MALAKIGVPELTVWDDDEVSEHNIPMSAYRVKDHMRSKVEALQEIVEDASGLKIGIRKERYAGQEPPKGALVVCVDSMDERRIVWQAVKRFVEKDPASIDILIDTRTAGKLLWVLSVCPFDPDDAAYYEHHVSYKKSQAAPHMCGLHGFMPMSYLAAARAVEDLTTWWMSGIKELHRRELIASPTAQEDA